MPVKAEAMGREGVAPPPGCWDAAAVEGASVEASEVEGMKGKLGG